MRKRNDDTKRDSLDHERETKIKQLKKKLEVLKEQKRVVLEFDIDVHETEESLNKLQIKK
jgi:hypothetical protein